MLVSADLNLRLLDPYQILELEETALLSLCLFSYLLTGVGAGGGEGVIMIK